MLVALTVKIIRIALLCIGGGYAVLPLLLHEAPHLGISNEEFFDIVSLAQITPGPLGLNIATYTGLKTAGIIGAVLVTLAFAVPTASVALICYKLFFNKIIKDAPFIASGIKGIGFGLLSVAFVSLIMTLVPYGWVPFIVFLICVFGLRVMKIHPLAFIGAAIIIAFIVGG